MSDSALLWLGMLVTLVVVVAIALLVYAAVLDGRDARIGLSEPPASGLAGGGEPAATGEDPGWTWPPQHDRERPVEERALAA